MQRSSLAPVLSATFSRVSCWIICNLSWSLGLFEDLDQTPPLGRGARSGLHHPDAVADAGLVGLVVRLESLGLRHDLAVQRVLDPLLDGHDHGLVHLVGHDDALAHLAGAAADVLVIAHPAHLSSSGSGTMPRLRSWI